VRGIVRLKLAVVLNKERCDIAGRFDGVSNGSDGAARVQDRCRQIDSTSEIRSFMFAVPSCMM